MNKQVVFTVAILLIAMMSAMAMIQANACGCGNHNPRCPKTHIWYNETDYNITNYYVTNNYTIINNNTVVYDINNETFTTVVNNVTNKFYNITYQDFVSYYEVNYQVDLNPILLQINGLSREIQTLQNQEKNTQANLQLLEYVVIADTLGLAGTIALNIKHIRNKKRHATIGSDVRIY
jgi:hypothetical protein